MSSGSDEIKYTNEEIKAHMVAKEWLAALAKMEYNSSFGDLFEGF